MINSKKYQFKGTPGPWDYEMDEDVVDRIYTGNSSIGYRTICDFDSSDVGRDEQIFNARLIAAAIDMFELIKQCLESFEIVNYHKSDGKNMRDECKKLLNEITLND